MPGVMTTLFLVGVVDRIEAEWAVVEWQPTAAVTDVAKTALHTRTKEGDRIMLLARFDPQGPSMARIVDGRVRLSTPQGVIHLPDGAEVPISQRYMTEIHTISRDSPGRAHPMMGNREHGGMDPASSGVGAPTIRRCDRTESAAQAADHREAGRSPTPLVPEQQQDQEALPPLAQCMESSHSMP